MTDCQVQIRKGATAMVLILFIAGVMLLVIISCKTAPHTTRRNTVVVRRNRRW